MTDLFPPGKGGGKDVAYGFKGKGVLIHLLVDANGMPLAGSVTAANGNERTEAIENVRSVHVAGNVGRPKGAPRRIAADKGYDSKALRDLLRRMGIQPEIKRRKWKGKKKRGCPLTEKVDRYVVERTFSWLQRKFRRLVVRWERTSELFTTFVMLGLAMLWFERILG